MTTENNAASERFLKQMFRIGRAEIFDKSWVESVTRINLNSDRRLPFLSHPSVLALALPKERAMARYADRDVGALK